MEFVVGGGGHNDIQNRPVYSMLENKNFGKKKMCRVKESGMWG